MSQLWQGGCSRAIGGMMITIKLRLIGIMEKKMETTGITGAILGLYRNNGNENGNYYIGVT